MCSRACRWRSASSCARRCPSTDDMVGALMDFEDITVRPDVTLEVVLRYLRRFDELPSQTDQVFVVDRDGAPAGRAADQHADRLRSRHDGRVDHAGAGRAVAPAREGRRRGFARSSATTSCPRRSSTPTTGSWDASPSTWCSISCAQSGEEDLLAQAGLREEEDVFASVWASFKNRWAWLAINLVTAFIASRVIGVFEGSIESWSRSRR